jgi:mannose-6-phosphate isomerase-like protein (cupin superfamily)
MAETEQTSAAAPLPGAVGISRLRVYDTETVDGLVGGSPHMHFVCAEGYVVLGGRGSVQTLGARGYEERSLEADKLVWFGPGLIHRLVNDGGLEILTLMQNAGLPEAGDAVFTFPRAVLEDPERYREAASLEPRDGERPIERAYARRDLAVEGFVALRAEFEAAGSALFRGVQPVIPTAPDLREIYEALLIDPGLQPGTTYEQVAELLRTNTSLPPLLGVRNVLRDQAAKVGLEVSPRYRPLIANIGDSDLPMPLVLGARSDVVVDEGSG